MKALSFLFLRKEKGVGYVPYSEVMGWNQRSYGFVSYREFHGIW